MERARVIKRIMDRGKKKPSKYIYTRIVKNGRKIVMRRRTKVAEIELRKAIA